MADPVKPRVGFTSPPKQPPATKSPPPRRATIKELQGKIAQGVTVLGMTVGMGDPVAGFVLVVNAEDFATAWADVAEVNPRVRVALEGLFAKSIYAAAATATAAIVIPLGTRAGLIPRFGLNPAVAAVETLEEAVANGHTLTDLLKAHEEARIRMQDLREEFEKTKRSAAGTPPPAESPDHYEAPLP